MIRNTTHYQGAHYNITNCLSWSFLLHWVTSGLVTLQCGVEAKEKTNKGPLHWWTQPPVCISNEELWISEANKRGHYRKATGSNNLFLWNMQARACLCPRKRGHSLLYSLQDYGSLPSLIFNKQSGLPFFPPLNKPIVESPMQQLCFPRWCTACLSD